MTEQRMRVRRRTRKVTQHEDTDAVKTKLMDCMDAAVGVVDNMNELQKQLADLETAAARYMEHLKIAKFTTPLAEGLYEHPPQKTTTKYNTEAIFEDVSPEDFLASVKIQKGLAEKVIDPKILKKHSTSTKSALKPKTFKLIKR